MNNLNGLISGLNFVDGRAVDSDGNTVLLIENDGFYVAEVRRIEGENSTRLAVDVASGDDFDMLVRNVTSKLIIDGNEFRFEYGEWYCYTPLGLVRIDDRSEEEGVPNWEPYMAILYSEEMRPMYCCGGVTAEKAYHGLVAAYEKMYRDLFDEAMGSLDSYR